MVYTRKNDEAVSPVIGVILMVAITVILAAVIAAFVFGMSGNINKTKVVAVTAQQPDGDHISVTYQGGQDALTFAGANVTITTSTGTQITNAQFSVKDPASTKDMGWLGTNVGSSTTANVANAFAGRDHVVVAGWFTDGTQQVLLDTYV
jgi:archaeal type IV pilus assembly protein PilA